MIKLRTHVRGLAGSAAAGKELPAGKVICSFSHLDIFDFEQQDYMQKTADVELVTSTGVNLPSHTVCLLQW